MSQHTRRSLARLMILLLVVSFGSPGFGSAFTSAHAGIDHAHDTTWAHSGSHDHPPDAADRRPAGPHGDMVVDEHADFGHVLDHLPMHAAATAQGRCRTVPVQAATAAAPQSPPATPFRLFRPPRPEPFV